MRRRAVATAVATLALAVSPLAMSGSADAAVRDDRAAPEVEMLAGHLYSPLSLDVHPNGMRFFSENFRGRLRSQAPGGPAKTLFEAKKGDEVGAVSTRGDNVYFAISGEGGGFLRRTGLNGAARVPVIADFGAHEKKTNPDKGIRYGFRKLGKACRDQIPQDFGPASYKGIVETHPYASLATGAGVYVADAAANAIFLVPRPGVVRTVGVIPPVPTTITAERAEAFGLPDCTIGKKYWFEGVPTDVEMGRDGFLYVTSLPGGPEDGSAGALGSVVRMNANTGATKRVVKGLVSATGLAVARNGDMYVAQLFAGSIVKIKRGTDEPKVWAEVNLPSDIEKTKSGLMALVNALPPEQGQPKGRLVQITP